MMPHLPADHLSVVYFPQLGYLVAIQVSAESVESGNADFAGLTLLVTLAANASFTLPAQPITKTLLLTVIF
jgi:hypothetical protein